MADYKTPQWLLPNEKNLAYPASGGGITGSGLSEDRHSLYSMEFDGTSYIDLGTDLDIFRYNINESYSVSLWYKTTSALGDKTIINLGANTYKFFLTSGNSGKISFGAGASTSIGAVYNWLPTAGALNDGNWHHICIVQDSSGGNVNLTPYVDGSSSGSGSSTAFTVQVNNRIGDGHYGGVEASIDEVSIFSRALSASEVTTLYNSGAPGNLMALSPKPIAYWPLGEQAQMGYSNWNFPNGSLQSHVVDFDGTDYISAGNVLDQSGTDAFSISGWFYLNSGGSNTIVSKMNSSFVGYQLYINAANKLKFLLQGTGNLSATGNTTLSLNTWYNVILTYDGSGTTGGINLYLNGATETFVGSGSNSGGVSNSENFEIGARTGAIDAIDGKLSNVAFWTSDQSANKDNIYNNGSPQSTYTATPTSWWKLNAADSSYNTATSTWTFTDGPGTNDGTSTTLPSTALVPSDLQFESPYSNYSLSFDGVDDYVDAGNDSKFNLTTGMTISAWINPTVAATNKFLVAKRWSTNSYQIATAGSINPQCSVWIGTTRYDALGSTVLSAGTWYHIVGTFDGSNVKVYLNGVLEDTTAASGSLDQSTDIVSIAKGLNNNAYNFNGKIDETAIWNTALTQAQINQVYNNGYPADLTSLSPISWWRLGEDAYFVSNVVTIPNKITGGPSGTGGGGDQSAFLVGEAPGSYANGLGSSLDVSDRIGDASQSTANSVSVNMIPSNRHSYPAGYLPTQVNNVYSMDFDGTSDYVEIANDTSLQLTDKLTLSCWIYADNASGTNSIIDKFFDSTDRSYMLRLQSSRVRVSLGNTSGSSSVNYQSTATISNSTWYHIATTFSSVDNEVKIYINGSLDSTHSKTDLISSNNQPLRIGTGYNLLNYFDGKIDEVAIFNYALSARQIKQDIYNGTGTVGGVEKTADLNNISNLTPPVAWYRMGD